jgi:integrase
MARSRDTGAPHGRPQALCAPEASRSNLSRHRHTQGHLAGRVQEAGRARPLGRREVRTSTARLPRSPARSDAGRHRRNARRLLPHCRRSPRHLEAARSARSRGASRDTSFHEYASRWHAARTGTVQPRTSEWEQWALSNHLLQHFASRRVDQTDTATVRAYVVAKQAEGVLSARSLNSTLRLLSLVLAEAVEDGYLAANPVTRARFAKAAKPARGWLEPDELADLLDACTKPGKPLVATMALAGLPVSEAAALRWRSVDLAAGRIMVEASKTDAGRRAIADLNREPLELLKTHRMGSRHTEPDELVFATATGRPKGRSSISRHVLKPGLDRANNKRAEAGRPPIARATAHDLRRTFAAYASPPARAPPRSCRRSATRPLRCRWRSTAASSPARQRDSARAWRASFAALNGHKWALTMFRRPAACRSGHRCCRGNRRLAGLSNAGGGTRTRMPPKGTPGFKPGASCQFRHPGGHSVARR